MKFLKANSKAIGAFVGVAAGSLLISLFGLTDAVGAMMITSTVGIAAAGFAWLFPANG